MLLLMLAAGGLGACASAGPSAPVVVVPDRTTSITLLSRAGQRLVMQNAAAAEAAPSTAAGPVRPKTLDAESLQALFDTFEIEGLFAHTLPAAPANANQALVLTHGDRTWCWTPGAATDPRTTSFVRARSYFLQLFNHARDYRAADDRTTRTLQGSARELDLRQRPGAAGTERQQ